MSIVDIKVILQYIERQVHDSSLQASAFRDFPAILLVRGQFFIKNALKIFPYAFRTPGGRLYSGAFSPCPSGIRKDAKEGPVETERFSRAAFSALRRSSGFPPPRRRSSIRAPLPGTGIVLMLRYSSPPGDSACPMPHTKAAPRLLPLPRLPRPSPCPDALLRSPVPPSLPDASALPRAASSAHQESKTFAMQEKCASRYIPPHPLFTNERFMRT